MEKLTPEWDAACRRLEDFLRAYAVVPRERLLGLTLELLAEARALHAQDPSSQPEERAMRLAIARADAWFAGLAGNPAHAARARIAYFSSGRCDLFLADPAPPDFVQAIRSASIQAAPALESQRVIRREIDYGAMEDFANQTWNRFSWTYVLQAFVIWAVIFAVSWQVYLHVFR